MSALPVPDDRPNPPAPSGWTERAACRGADPDLFYPPEGERGGQLALRELLAKRICATCPVVDECAGYALAVDERYGCGAASPQPSGSDGAAGEPEPGQSGHPANRERMTTHRNRR